MRCDHCGAPATVGEDSCRFCGTRVRQIDPDAGGIIAATSFGTGSYGRFEPSQHLASTGTTLSCDRSRAILTVTQTTVTGIGILNLFEQHTDVSVTAKVRFIAGLGATFGLVARWAPDKKFARYDFTAWASGSMVLDYDETDGSDRLVPSQRPAGFRVGELNEMTLKVDDTRLRMYLNGALIGSARDSRLAAGRLGIRVGGKGTRSEPVVLEIGDIVVREIG
jgi:hypothetical protein